MAVMQERPIVGVIAPSQPQMMFGVERSERSEGRIEKFVCFTSSVTVVLQCAPQMFWEK